MVMRRYIVVSTFITPKYQTRTKRFWTRSGAERYAQLYDREAWHAGILTMSFTMDLKLVPEIT